MLCSDALRAVSVCLRFACVLAQCACFRAARSYFMSCVLCMFVLDVFL